MNSGAPCARITLASAFLTTFFSRDRPCQTLSVTGVRPWLAKCAVPEVVEHEQPDRRGQIALLAVCVDLANQLGQRHVACAGDLFHAGPERLFEADAGLVAGNHDRSLDDG